MTDALEDLRRRFTLKEDVEEEQLAQLRVDPNPEVRKLAARMAFEQAMRPALDAIAGAIAAEGRWETEADWVSRGAQLARYDEPVPYMLKHVGLEAIRAGDLERAITLLFHAVARAMRQGQSGDPRSRHLMRYALDPDFDTAYEAIASRLSVPRYYRGPGEKKRIAVMIPFDREGNSVGLVGLGIAAGLCERGLDAFVVTTGMVQSQPDTPQLRALEKAGSRLIEPGGQNSLERTLWLMDFFERDPVDAVLYVSDPQDPVPRLCEIVGLANAQLFVNAAYEHRTGRLDAIIETVEAEQVVRSLRPDIALFIPSSIVREREIREATAGHRADYKVPEDAVVLATFGRLSKLSQRGFLEAVTTILRAEPNAVWVIGGAGTADEGGAVHDALRAANCADRVINLGVVGNEMPDVLKMSDIYLDPFPFPGAQSTGEAMFAGLAVVAMRRARDVDLDPTETGPTTAAGEAIIGDAAPMVPNGDIEAYVALARRFINDEGERRSVGAALQKRAETELTWNGMIDRYSDAIDRAIEQRRAVLHDELAAVFVAPSALAFERVIAAIRVDRGLYAPKKIIAVVNGPHPDVELRAERYGDDLQIISLPAEREWSQAARAGIEACETALCAVVDGTLLPGENWTAEAVASARRRGFGKARGGVVVATSDAGAITQALEMCEEAREVQPAIVESPNDYSNTLLDLQDRYAAVAEFSDDEITALEEHPDSRIRALGYRIDFERKAGPAFASALDLAEIDESLTDDLIGFLSGAASARHPAAYVSAMKLRARRSYETGNYDDALKSIGTAMHVGMTAGQMGVKRWHPLLHVANDPDFETMLDEIAAKMSAPRTYRPNRSERLRIAIVVSVDLAANSLSLVASRYAISLQQLGHDVSYVSTEFYRSPPNMPTGVGVMAAGCKFIRAEGESFTERINDLLDRFTRNPVDVVVYLVDPADTIARIVETTRLADAQALVTAGFDQRSGSIDAYIHSVQPAQIKTAFHPERSIFIASAVARDQEILSARPVLRSDIDLRPDDIVLCTVGRLNKSVQRGFLEAVFGALRRERRLRWLLLGPREEHSLKILDRAMGNAGVGGQVQWPGVVHERLASYLLTADIYCDTFPFPGGQSLGEAMFAGLPIVAMQRMIDADLDPAGTGPTSSTAEIFIGDAVELVPAGDIEAYTERILAYAADRELRQRDGARVRERAIATLTWETAARAYSDALAKLADRELLTVR